MPLDPDPRTVPRPSDSSRPPLGSTAAGDPGLEALPAWLRRAVEAWGVRRSGSSWVGGVLAGVAERYRIDPLLARGVFVALCAVSAGLGLLAYAAAWAVLPDPDGRVQYGRLRRGEWRDATVAIAVIGGVGALNLLVGAGFTLIAPAIGGPGSLLGLAALAVLVWWLVTRWDGRTQSRTAPPRAAAPEGTGRAAAEPAWYLRRREQQDRAARPDEHGFHADWIDPETGTWRDRVHPREERAAARLADEERRVAAPSGGGSAVRAGDSTRVARPRISRTAQALTYVLAVAAAGVSLLSVLLGRPHASATVLIVPPLMAALAVVVLGMVLALLRGRRPGSLAPASGILVGAVALQTAVAVAVL